MPNFDKWPETPAPFSEGSAAPAAPEDDSADLAGGITVLEHLQNRVAEHQICLKKLQYLINNLPEEILRQPHTIFYM